ncbi:NUDIX domain-containing protein [Oleiharenicola lentus]|jgi:8-oxo-dGTP pyrophosphatase MutT (NUDIX family)|uniref:NUDIX domain-containing protein n=1 Tax=Oleiharenicola lentus TaxID=2508720 RepID=A0A4Q1C4U4_9BACT|nr:NUDIX hydrolase [Oleiharenicola lentus]RXK53305.1 NUDIX domain-containing protein [Oleiharenicola lentus]
MTLADTIALLRRYEIRAEAGHEAAMLAEYFPFMAAHPDCLGRTCLDGHLTASAWIVDAARTRTLLTHHRKLDRWLQLGGHVDGEADLALAAMREAQEESGLARLRLASPEVFDVDRHRIPARGAEPEHWHFDVRFLIEADPAEPLQISSESKDLAWVRLEDVARLNPEESLARLVRKTERHTPP